ncbi:hypothetical protein [Patulibacter defluvii]|uniref:hypothetical protein n=1 Tax=Patulibacter defluvii TaxID=3095358 RepID=UPI002A7528AD|nr:hypothetical protein [Patulibacter sp. DM4]
MTTTGVGSLPFAEPAAAVRHATRAYGLPFCPQLPPLDGDMVSEWLGPDWARASCGWSADRDRERPVAWDAVRAALAQRPPAHRLVKLQVTGPLTLAIALERAAGRPGHGREARALARDVGAWLAANVGGQAALLREQGLDALVVVDEPGLAHADLAAADAWAPLARSGAAWGLHVCSQVPWAAVVAAAPDVLSFDVTRYPVGGEAADAVAALLAGGGRIAWGAVDPVRPDGPANVASRVTAAVAAVAARGPAIERVFARSLVTPSCGTGRLTPRRERLVASVLAAGAEVALAARAAWPGERAA